MKPTPKLEARRPAFHSGYMLVEALVYISLLFVVLGVGYMAMDHCIDNSIVLHRSADDIASSLRAGERWRADVRSADKKVWLETGTADPVLHLEGARGEITYRFTDGALFRRIGSASWTRLLANVRSSTMESDQRQHVVAWHWELELQPRAKASVKAGRLRPLFTFIAVPEGSSAK